MALSQTSKMGLAVVASLGFVVWLTTVGFFFLFSTADSRNGSFVFALGYVSFLEWLAFSYMAVPFIPGIRKRIVAALYPAFGIVIGLFIVRATIAALITHTVPFLDSTRTHLVCAIIGFLPFLFLMGILLVLNTWQAEQTEQLTSERADLASTGADVTEIYQIFLNNRRHLGEAGFLAIEPQLKRLKERFQFCTPFHRQSVNAPHIGDEIQQKITSLQQLVQAIPTAPQNEASAQTIQQTVAQILQQMERREKLLVK